MFPVKEIRRRGFCSLSIAVVKLQDISIIKKMLEKGADPNERR